ncbi:hypothetical protein K3495_g3273 [Podosphaera aphanis]|nr:hypothetical protein K3495_g3273 [Podosphaera aphanis]
MAAKSGTQDVWRFINPSLRQTARISIPQISERPKPSDINSTALTISNLTALEVEDYKIRLAEWKENKSEIDEIKRLIGLIQNKVLGSISEKLLPQLKGKSTVAEILYYLSKRYRPTDQARRQATIASWNKIQRIPNDQAISSWLDQWELVYAEAKEINLPHVTDPQAQYSFLYSTRRIAGAWAELKLATIDDQVSAGEPVPDLYDLIEAFRHKDRLNAVFNDKSTEETGGTNSSGVFMTVENGSETIHKGRDQSGQKACLCGLKHKFEECFYLNFKNTKRPINFRYKREVFEKINEKLKATYMSRVRTFIDKRLGYDPKKTPELAMSQQGPNPQPSEGTSPDKAMGSFINHTLTMTSSFTVDKTSKYHLNRHWVLDGGSDIHICNKSMHHLFSPYIENTNVQKVVAGATEYEVEAWGTCKVDVTTPHGRNFILLKRVAYIPEFMTSLISLSKITRKNVHWSSRKPNILENLDGSIFCWLFKSGEHIVFESQEIIYEENSEIKDDPEGAFTSGGKKLHSNSSRLRQKTFSKLQLHRILGHPSPEVIDHVAEGAREGDITIIGERSPKTVECKTCALSKSHQVISRSSEKEHPETKPFERITVDLIPIIEAYNSHTQIIHFQCSKTLFNMIFTMYSKSESPKIVEKVLNLVISMNYKVRFIHLDGESSLQSKLDDISVRHGIKVERSAPYLQSQNGQSEVNGRWIILKARAFAIEANLPSNLWPNIVVTVGYLMNRTPSRKLGWKTPFECVYNYKPLLSHLDILGSKVYSLKKNIPKLERLLSRAHIGYLIGWESTNIYKVWVPSINKVINTRDVLIDSGNLYNPHDIDLFSLREAPDEEIIQALEWESMREDIMTITDIPSTKEILQDMVPALTSYKNIVNEEKAITTDTSDVSVLQPNSENNDSTSLIKDGNRLLPKAKGNTAVRGALINPDLDERNILKSDRRRNQAKKGAWAQQYFLSFSTASLNLKKERLKLTRESLPPAPKGWQQMLRHKFAKEFTRAAEKEYYTLEEKGTWNHINEEDVPVGAEIIPVIWIFSYKFDSDGVLIKFKARLCARGDLQVTEEETYAATLASQSFRAMMAITAAHDLEIRQYDIVNAFVNAPIRGDIYCYTPKGFQKEVDGKKSVLKLRKALYGFKFSPLFWYDEFVSFLLNHELYQVPGVNCMFTNHFMTLIFYVDDIMITFDRQDTHNADKFIENLSRMYEIRRISDDSYYLGIRIIRDRSTKRLWLSQQGYIESLKSTFNIDVGKPPKTPLPQTAFLPYDGKATESQIKGYQQKVGKVNFAAVMTRADIARAVSVLSKFLQNPGPQHLEVIDHLLKYLISTSNLSICYDGLYVKRKRFRLNKTRNSSLKD